MASNPEMADQLLSIRDRLICSSCAQLFTDPITSTCGHSFCRTCLENHSVNQCPVCKATVERVPKVNVVLSQIVQQVNVHGGNESESDEVECEVCNLKANKSCLQCLSSFCSVHLRKHSHVRRRENHQLVAPVRDLDQRACLEHGCPLVFYNTNQQVCMCVRCLRGFQDIVFIEDEAETKKAQIRHTVDIGKNKTTQREKEIKGFSADHQRCMRELSDEIQEIETVFNNILTVMKETRNNILQPMLERRRSLDKEEENVQNILRTEVDQRRQTIHTLEDISNIEDPLIFLLTYSSNQVEPDIQNWTNVNLDTNQNFGSMRTATTQMMERIQLEVDTLTPIEIRRVSRFPVDVKLDPTTAHRRLRVSEDCRTVKDGGENQEVGKSPQRFDKLGSILGDKGITSGKSYLEVEVSNKTGWELGVTRGDANRQGNVNLNPESGYWIVAHYDDKKFAALKSTPLRLFLSKKPKKVGMFVDYEEGLVSFYDVGSRSHIYSFTEGSFRGEIVPYFSPHAKKDEANSEPLVLTPVTP